MAVSKSWLGSSAWLPRGGEAARAPYALCVLGTSAPVRVTAPWRPLASTGLFPGGLGAVPPEFTQVGRIDADILALSRADGARFDSEVCGMAITGGESAGADVDAVAEILRGACRPYVEAVDRKPARHAVAPSVPVDMDERRSPVRSVDEGVRRDSEVLGHARHMCSDVVADRRWLAA